MKIFAETVLFKTFLILIDFSNQRNEVKLISVVLNHIKNQIQSLKNFRLSFPKNISNVIQFTRNEPIRLFDNYK